MRDAPQIALIEEVRETFVNVWWRQENRLVASIELLSPSNKAPGRGREQYINKQQALLASAAHLLEVDLLRGGQHTVAVSESSLQTRADYIVCLHRATAAQYEFWQVPLRSRLPRVSVPLNAGNPDLILDLGSLWNAFYETSRLDEVIDYQAAPVPPFRSEDEAWSDQILRAAGKRF